MFSSIRLLDDTKNLTPPIDMLNRKKNRLKSLIQKRLLPRQPQHLHQNITIAVGELVGIRFADAKQGPSLLKRRILPHIDEGEQQFFHQGQGR